MRSTRLFMITRLSILACGIGILWFGLPKSVAAQNGNVEGITEITDNTTFSEIDAYSKTTILDYTLVQEGYSAYVFASIYQNNGVTPIKTGDAFANADPAVAQVNLVAPISTGNDYEVTGDHWVYLSGNPIYLGSETVSVSDRPPGINSFTPTFGYPGTSGQIVVQGTDLVDFRPPQVSQPSFGSGSGVTLTEQSGGTSNQVTLNYTIDLSASTGGRNIALTTRFGIGTSTQQFTVGDPTPVIQSVSPAVWQAGNPYTLTISGSGFGTSPGVNISSSYVTVGTVTVINDSTLSVPITVSSSAPAGPATVQVTSAGYGSGFFSVSGSTSGSNSYPITIQSVLAPTPQIQLYGTTITSPQSMVVGQEIALSAMVNLPGGQSICSQSWSNPAGPTSTAVGGYSASSSSGSVTSMPSLSSTTCTTTSPFLPIKFYWVDAGSRQITYTYTMTNGQSSSTSVTFNVTGPTGVSVATQIGQATVEPLTGIRVDPNGIPNLVLWGIPIPPNGVAGIKFQASATPPNGNNGAYSWVQLVPSDPQSLEGLFFRGPCTGAPSPSNPQLDTEYPYGAVLNSTQTPVIPNDVATDNPSFPLNPRYGEAARSFTATMYLMWTPAKAACNDGSACTIPIPLGSVVWHFSGDAINTLSTQQGVNGTTWMMWFNGQAPTPTFQPSHPNTDPTNGFPVWGAPSPYLGVLSCPH